MKQPLMSYPAEDTSYYGLLPDGILQLTHSELFNRKVLYQQLNPDVAVTHGVGILAANLSCIGDEATKSLVLIDVTPMSFGLGDNRDVMKVVIPRNSPLPMKKEHVATTSHDYQRPMRLLVYQGERSKASEYYLLGDLVLQGLPLAPRRDVKSIVCYEIDVNRILNISARETTTGKSNAVRVTNTDSVSTKEIEKMIKDAGRYKIEDEVHMNKRLQRAKSKLTSTKDRPKDERRASDEIVKEDMKLWTFKIMVGNDDKPKIMITYKGGKKEFAVEEILSMVLAKMKEITQKYLAMAVEKAVITVTIEVVHMVNEPTTAAIAYALDKRAGVDGKMNVLVFDLGGDTFDVSLLTIYKKGIIEVKATGGDTHLGDFSAKFMRAKFEEVNMDLLRKCMEHVEMCLRDANMSKDSIDEVILVGGSIKIPKVEELNVTAGPSVVNMVECNNSSRYNDSRGKCKHHDTKADPNKKPKDDDVAWWVDSEAIMHVCKDRCWFKTYELLNDGSILHMGNESTAVVHGRSCVDLRELEEEVYMNQPLGFILPGNENKVCKLIKSLYGLKQAPKKWHQKFDEVVFSNGYLLNQADKCVYSKFDESGKGVIICLYVDDMLIFGTDQVQASKKQTCITGSTMEYEFVVLAAGGKEAEWLKNLLLEIPLWFKPMAPISIPCDSVATLAKAYSQIHNGKSRHLGVKHSMIRKLITNGVISIEFVSSQQNLVDHLTKGLARDLVIKSAEEM
nr:heat shock 70 kDa protein [Tanacetum cinerariifolium]